MLPGAQPYRDSVESGYASMAHFLSRFPDPFGWNALQYGGLPTHDWYLPVAPYAAGALIRAFSWVEPLYVYRGFTVVVTCAGPVTLFLLFRYCTRSFGWGLVAAVLYTAGSPSYGLFPLINLDRGLSYLPWRWHVLAKYGEGPHNIALVLMPLALMACWRAGAERGFRAVFTAAALLATVALTNWIGSVATAWCCLMLLLSSLGTAAETGFLARRVIYAGLLGYLLAAFWLTPSFISTTMFNWPTDAYNYKAGDTQYKLMAGLMAGPLVIWALFRVASRDTARTHFLCWTLMCLYGFAYITVLYQFPRLDTIPESRRYALEVEFFGVVAFAEICRLLWTAPERMGRVAAILLVAAAAHAGTSFAQQYPQAWTRLRPGVQAATPEFQASKAIESRAPAGRAMVSGGTRFRFNAFTLLAQTGGTFESGLRNRFPLYAAYHVRVGIAKLPERRIPDAMLLLRALGVEYLALHGAGSAEYYRDFRDTPAFATALEQSWRNGDDFVVRVPFNGLAHLVRSTELPAYPPFGYQAPMVEPYVAAMDDGSRPRLASRWTGQNRFEISGAIPEGMQVATRISYYPTWEAAQDGKPVGIREDRMGWIIVDAAPALRAHIVLRYRAPLEQVLCTAISILALVVSVWALRRRPAAV